MEGWKTYRLEEIANVKGGKRLPKGKKLLEDPTPFPYIRVSDFDNYTVDQKNIKYLSKEIWEGIQRYIIKKEDIYISIAGTIGLVGTIPANLDGANLTENAARLILKDNEVDRDYLKYYLSESGNRDIIQSRKSKNAQPKLSLSNIKSLEIDLPPFPEQRKIAYVLSTIQKAIEQQDKLIRTTTELKKALMQKHFTEGLHGEKQKKTEIGLVPESWEVVRLSEVCEKPQYGFTDSASSTGNAKFLRITDITEFEVNWDTVPFCNCPDMQKYKLINGDIVFARIGATTGKSYIIEKPPKSVFASYLIRIRCKNDILPGFLIYYFKTEMYWNQINSRKGDNLKGGVNGSVLSRLIVPKPKLKEQKPIASIFQTLDKKIEYHRKKKQTLSDLFKTLLHELMTGQRRVNEIDFENDKEELLMAAEPKMEYNE